MNFTGSLIFEPILPGLHLFSNFECLPSIEELNKVLNTEQVRFVPQAARSQHFQDGYEPRIFLRNEVQTRDNCWHDFFNALVWHRFKKAKRAINRLHYHFQISRYPSKQRLPTENMLTLFDENGAIILSQDPKLLDLIRAHEWHKLFWQQRDYTQQQLRVFVFGHALYEKALNPYIGMTANCLLFESTNFCNDSADSLVAQFLLEKNSTLKPKDLSPLPILGIPGWHAENNNENFYANKNYFRPLRNS